MLPIKDSSSVYVLTPDDIDQSIYVYHCDCSAHARRPTSPFPAGGKQASSSELKHCWPSLSGQPEVNESHAVKSAL